MKKKMRRSEPKKKERKLHQISIWRIVGLQNSIEQILLEKLYDMQMEKEMTSQMQALGGKEEQKFLRNNEDMNN